MEYELTTISDDLGKISRLPRWVTSWHAETPETVAFRGAAALTVLADPLVRAAITDRVCWATFGEALAIHSRNLDLRDVPY